MTARARLSYVAAVVVGACVGARPGIAGEAGEPGANLGASSAAASEAGSEPVAKLGDDRRPSVFLSCPQECFDGYLRQELSYFDFVRDPHLADITLVIVRQKAGNGGERFTVTPARLGRSPLAKAVEPRSLVVGPGTPPGEARRRLRDVLLRVLHGQLTGTEHEASFGLTLPRRDGTRLSTLTDPWNYWVVAPELRGEGDAATRFLTAEMTAALNVRRITDLSKLRVTAAYPRRWMSYRLEDGSRVSADVYGWDGRALYARSLGAHWALGGVATGKGSQYENLKGHVHGGPLVEFNVFPYAENASRQLRLAYQAGAWANWYFEPNRAGLLRETRPYHALALIADINQPWGSIQWVGQVNAFVNAPDLHRLSTGAIVSLRLVEGFAVSLEGQAALLRDLISLRGREITDVEILLWTAQQETDFTVELKLAISYTFGSVHNTIVNPRFGRVDLEKE